MGFAAYYCALCMSFGTGLEWGKDCGEGGGWMRSEEGGEKGVLKGLWRVYK